MLLHNHGATSKDTICASIELGKTSHIKLSKFVTSSRHVHNIGLQSK